MCPYSDSKKKKEYYDGHSKHWDDYVQDTSDIEEMALKARLSLMADYFTDTYGKCKNHWE